MVADASPKSLPSPALVAHCKVILGHVPFALNFLGDDDCFYCHFWRNNAVIAFKNLSSFQVLTSLHILSGVICVVCPFAGDEKLKKIHVDVALLL